MSSLLAHEALPFVFFLGFFVWSFSTASGGGGPLLFLPAVSFVAPLREVSPITCVTAGLVSVHRLYLFRGHIDWRVLAWWLPGSLIGATVGVQIFAAIHEDWLMALLGTFLVYHALYAMFHRGHRSFVVKRWYYTIAGIVFAGTSAIVGGAGPGINALLLNDDVSKERLIATKAVAATAVQTVKLIGYLHFAQIGSHVLLLGGIAAIGAMLGNVVGKHVLNRLPESRFRTIANGLILTSGLLLLYRFFSIGSS